MTHKADPAFTPKCRILREGGSCRFTFFCGICEHRYTTPPLQAENAGEARLKAEADARLHFNWCPKCGRWVCDEHFNEGRTMCTDCAPRVCRVCGARVPRGDQYCTSCGAPQFETETH